MDITVREVVSCRAGLVLSSNKCQLLVCIKLGEVLRFFMMFSRVSMERMRSEEVGW